MKGEINNNTIIVGDFNSPLTPMDRSTKQEIKMETISYLSIITLNVCGLNTPSKRQRLAGWIQKQDPYICCLQETHFKTSDTYRLKVKGWEKKYFMQTETKRKQELQYSYQIK